MPCNCEQPNTSGYNAAHCGSVPPCPASPALTCPDPNPCDGTVSADCVTYTPANGVQQSCSGLKTGDTLTTVLQKLDARICQCCGKGATSPPLMVFYVDGNNTNTGDGSILNHFQTIDLAYNAVLGTGTVAAPQNQNVAVSVAAYSYTTSKNIYLGYTTYNFADGTTVTYTGTAYFIDTSMVTNSPGIFKITGGLAFKTATGGFIRNQGAPLSGGAQKQCFLQAFSIWGNTNAGGSMPLIVHNQTSGSGYGALVTEINIQPNGSIASAWETVIALTNGGSFGADLGGGSITYGLDYITGNYAGTAGRNLLSYNGADPSTTISNIQLGNGTFFTLNNTDMVYMAGTYVYFKLYNLRSVVGSLGLPKPNTFLYVGNIAEGASAGGDHTLMIQGCYLNAFAFSTTTVIYYSGSGTLNDLEMRDCVLYNNCGTGSNISLGGSTTGSFPSTTFNILRNRLHLTQVPVFVNNASAISGGLVAGDVYTNGQGGLMMVY